jgi:hypothetical protein
MSEVKGFSPEEQLALKAALADVETTMGTKAAQKIEAEMKKVGEELGKKYETELADLKSFKVSAEKTMADNQKWIDEQIAKGKTVQIAGATANDALYKALGDNEARIKNYAANGRMAISFEVKTVGNIGANSNISVSGTPSFQHGGALWEPGRKGFEARHIRDLCQVVSAPVGQDTYVVRDNGGEGAPTSVAVGAAKPQSDRDWVKTVVPYTKIAHYYKVPEEYLQDIAWMQSEISGIGVEELLALEDTKALTNSTGGEFSGLNQTFNSTAYSTPTALSAFFTGSDRAASSNNYDVLVAAMTQLRITNPSSIPNAILVHPGDYAKLLLTKDADRQYIFGSPYSGFPNVQGIPIVMHNSVTTDKFYLGDFTKVKFAVRTPLSVRIFDQDQDDAIKNLVTVVIEERISMAADRADRIIYGDFSDAQTALES